jgi:hypothetical protein
VCGGQLPPHIHKPVVGARCHCVGL